MPISKSFKRKWVKALRSGNYKQGEGFLQNRNAYCCLGVACIVAGVPIPKSLDDRATFNYEPLRKATGLTYTDAGTLSHLNDDGHSFAEIADYIEKHLGSRA